MARPSKTLAETFKHLRQQAGQTLRELEANSGVNRSVISRIENGQYQQPRPATLIRLAEALGADASELLTAAGHTAVQADALPALPVYLRTKYGHLPAAKRAELTAFVEQIEAEYGKPSSKKSKKD